MLAERAGSEHAKSELALAPPIRVLLLVREGGRRHAKAESTDQENEPQSFHLCLLSSALIAQPRASSEPRCAANVTSRFRWLALLLVKA